MTIPTAPAAALLLLAAAAATAQTNHPPTDIVSPRSLSTRVRVGTWNLEHFGQRKPPRKPEDYQKIAAKIHAIGVDVLALQEIAGAVPVRTLCAALGDGWQFVLGSSGEFRDASGRINVGFLWNSARVELLKAEELLQLPRDVGGIPIFHRVPITAAFRNKLPGGRTGADFRLVTVHLKASQGAKNENKRKLEVTALRRWLNNLLARADEDRDILVLGDFNHTYDAPAHQAFRTDGFIEYLRPAKPGMTIVHFDSPIDHIACVGKGIRDELRPDTMRVHRAAALENKEAWRASYSDHVPVTIDIEASTDNDPNAQFGGFRPGQRLLAGGIAEARAHKAAASTQPAQTTATPTTAKPTNAAPRPTPLVPKPFTVGNSVILHLTTHGLIRGRLLAPLGADWAYLETDAGSVAVPVRSIARVQAGR